MSSNTSRTPAVSTGNQTGSIIPGVTLERPTITAGLAKRGALKDTAEAIAYVRHTKSIADRVTGEVMWDAALVTFDLFAKATTPETPEPKAPAGYDRQADFAEAIGFTNGYVTKLRNLGRAACVHSVSKASGDWSFLAQHVGTKVVAEAVRLEDSSEFKARLKVLRAQYAKDGKFLSAPSAPTGEILSGGPMPEGQSEVTPAPAEAPAKVDPLDVVKAALDALDAACKAATFTGDTWSVVETRLETLIGRETQIIRHKAEAKPKPTPKTVGRVKAEAKAKAEKSGVTMLPDAPASESTVPGEVVETKSA